MIQKVISGGQTGVDRAALDFALENGIPCGGWCPQGRKAEDGMIPPRYPLQETPSPDYKERTEWNVRDSDGTLILTWGKPTQGTAFTIEVAQRLGKPCLIIDLLSPPFWPAVYDWFKKYSLNILNVAGPRESKVPEIYGRALDYLEKIFL
jgi:hypothetical protein